MLNIYRALKSVSFLWASSILGSGSTFLIYMMLARELEVSDFGEFSSAISIAMGLSILGGFGISQVWLKVFGQNGMQSIVWVKPSLRLLFITVVVSCIVLNLWAGLGPHNDTTKYVLVYLCFFVIGQVSVELVISKIQLEEKYEKLSIWQISPNFLRLVVVFFLLEVFGFNLSVLDVALVYSAVGGVVAVMSVLEIKKMVFGDFNLAGHFDNKLFHFEKVKLVDVYSEAWPFTLASFFAFFYLQVDVVMVKYMIGNVEAGEYNVAFVIMTAIMIFPTVIYSKFLLPKYHRWAVHNRDFFYIAYRKGNKLMLFFGVVVMILTVLFSGYFVLFLFGREYYNSVFLVNLLALTIPVYFVSYSVGATLVTRDNMRHKVKLMGVVAILNFLLNMFLIPYYGAVGAGVATIISNIVLLFLYFRSAEKYVFYKEWSSHVEKY